MTELRKEYNPERVLWPVDITIAGSFGIGTFSEGQDIEGIIESLEPLISEHYFTDVEFTGIKHFQNTGIYYLQPKRELFNRIHKAVTSSGVCFDTNHFPFKPHCTLKASQPSRRDEVFQRIEFPKLAKIECFSLYQPKPNGGLRLHKFI